MRAIMYKPLAYTVGTSSVKILCGYVPDFANQLSEWTAGATYSEGDRCYYGDNIYHCISGGVATAACAPTATDGDDTTDAAVTWRAIRQKRNQLIVTNDSANVVYLAFGNAAEASKGIRLNANGGAFNAVNDIGYCPQGDIYAIASGADSNLGIQEF